MRSRFPLIPGIESSIDAVPDQTFADWQTESLLWLPERGMGFFPVQEASEPYNLEYFRKYQRYAGTALGKQLTETRMQLVTQWINDMPLVDIGIGCGQFVEWRGGETSGYDVNQVAIDWLVAQGLYHNIFREETPAASFWDSLEHILNPASMLQQIQQFVFVSLPIFEDAAHVLRSKHFRRTEHRWYWTEVGLLNWMQKHGFAMREHNDMESQLGREDIQTYVFERAA